MLLPQSNLRPIQLVDRLSVLAPQLSLNSGVFSKLVNKKSAPKSNATLAFLKEWVASGLAELEQQKQEQKLQLLAEAKASIAAASEGAGGAAGAADSDEDAEMAPASQIRVGARKRKPSERVKDVVESKR